MPPCDKDVIYVVDPSFPHELSHEEFEDGARRAAACGATHVMVSSLPFSRWQLENPDDPHPDWMSWPVWSMINPAVFKVVVPPPLRDWLPEKEARGNLERLKDRCAILRSLGLQGAFFGNDPMWLPEPVFRAHPEWRGAQGELSRIAHLPYFSPCIDHPEVLEMYRRAMRTMAEELPEITVYRFFTNDSCGGVCWTRPYPGDNGPEWCRNRPVNLRISGFLDALQDGARQAGVSIDVNLDNLTHVDAPDLYTTLGEGQGINGRRRDGSRWCADVRTGDYTSAAIFPVYGLPRPLAFLDGLEQAFRSDASRVVVHMMQGHEFVTDALWPMFRANPTCGPASRMAMVRTLAAEYAGEDHAETMVDIWSRIDSALAALAHIHVKGTFNIFMVGPAMMRWLIMPLVPDPSRLSGTEKQDYMTCRIVRTAQEADSYHCLLGEPGITGSAGVWMARHILKSAADTLAAAAALAGRLAEEVRTPAAPELATLALRLRALGHLTANVRHFIEYQHTLFLADGVHTSLLWRPEKFGNNDINQASLELRRIARAEADNVVALARLLESTQECLLVTADSPQQEDPFHFHPELAGQLRRKCETMMRHWGDYLDMYPPWPQIEERPADQPRAVRMSDVLHI